MIARRMNDRGACGYGVNVKPNLAASLFAAAVVLLAAGPARADDPTPMHTIVSGASAGSSDLVVRAIEAELGRPVTALPDDAACPAPCAAVSIDTAHGTATVRVTSGSGDLRQRTISIPGDPAGAAEVIALLVGNLARDEATVLISSLEDAPDDAAVAGDDELVDPFAPPAPGLPAPAPPFPPEVPFPGQPAPAPPPYAVEDIEPVLAAEPEREGRTSLSIGLVPPLSIRFGGAYRRGMSIQALVGVSRETHLLSLGGVVDVVRGGVYGAQIAGVVASAGRVRGMQIAGVAATAADVTGLQIGGVVAHSRGDAELQIAGAAGYAGGRVNAQIAGAAVSADRAGLQIAGAATHVRGNVGTQIAGAVNVAGGAVYALQVGTVNVAGTVHGLQLGVVNVARRSAGGLSLGLINIVPGGRSELEATVDTEQVGAVMFRHGGKRWHNVYGVAGRATGGLFDSQLTDDDVFMYGFGFGPTFRAGPVTIDVDAIGWHVLYGDGTHGHADVLAQFRVVGAVPIGGGVELIGGAAANAYITTDPSREGFATKRIEPAPGTMDEGARVMVTPTAFVGVRL
jgi:hypothetical protein